MIQGKALGRETGAGVAHDHGRLEGQGIHERGHVGSEVLGPVAGLWAIGVAVPALGDREGTNGGGRCGSRSSNAHHESVGPWSRITGTPDGSPCST